MLSRVIAARAVRQYVPPLSSLRIQNLHVTSEVAAMKGEIYDKQPMKLFMEKGKKYKWCACGLSKKQPMCDGNHKHCRKGLKPLEFTPDASKEYFLCNCKQTNQVPFCDGTHNTCR